MPLRSTLLLALLGANALPAQQPSPSRAYDHGRDAPVAQSTRATGAIRIDGVLDDAAWRDARPITDLRQLDPAEGQPVSERTEILIVHDDDAIYVGARMYDRSPARTRLGRRDMGMSASDWLTIIFDSKHDHLTAVGFEINPAGVRRDQTRGSSGEDDSWDPVWQAATTVSDSGWFAELRIPFSQLRFGAQASQTWGMRVERQIARNQEFAFWPFVPRDEPSGIPRYGHLTGMTQIATGKRVEVMPYVVTRAEYIDPRGNPLRSDREAEFDGGVDLKLRLTSSLTLDVTANPDFGQVEVDPAVINLTAFETFFPEKRPFFIEGSELFSFGSGGANQVFYSRRIGKQPTLQPAVSARDVPDATRILGAAKLTGRTEGGWAVGLLDAVTAREIARYRESDGTPGEIVAEPLTNHFVGRARREARGGQTALGVFLGSVRRDLENDALRGVLRSAATTGGVDIRHQWNQRTWTLQGFLSGSRVAGDSSVMIATQRLPYHYFQRPDAEHLEVDSGATSLTGLSAELEVSRVAGRHWYTSASLGTISPDYEVSDLGFQRRGDRIDANAAIEYAEPRPGDVLRRWGVGLFPNVEHNYAGDRISNRLFTAANVTWLNYWSLNLQLGLNPWITLDDRLTRGGPGADRPTATSYSAQLRTDPRSRLVWRVAVGGENGDAGRTAGISATATIRPQAHWELTLGPVLDGGRNTAQFLDRVVDPAATRTYGARYVFAQVDQRVFWLDTRLNYTFTPALSLQAYVQPFVATGKFGPAKELEAPRTFRFLEYGRDVGEIVNDTIFPNGAGNAAGAFPVPKPDFNIRSLRGNAVLRWEWRPGSTMFVAWQQTRRDFEPIGDFDLRNDLRALSATSPDNVFLVKLTYWMNP